MRKFTPAFGLGNRHLQTIYSTFFRKEIKLDYEIEEFILVDRDFIECFWLNKQQANSNIFVVFHGLEGSFQSPYIQGIMKALRDKNQAVVLVHFRACANKDNLAAKSYHSGHTLDAIEYLKHLNSLYPKSNILAIGYSVGSNMLLKLMGKDFVDNFIQKAICISTPFDLDICADVLNKGFAKVYGNHLLEHLKEKLLRKYEKHDFKALLDLDKKRVKKIATIREFDELYTSKINGFGNAKNYYKINSSKQYLKNIETKTLIIHSLDDPFMNEKVIPKKEELSSSCTLELYEKGGHLGFIGGTLFKPRYVLEEWILEYLQEYINKDSSI